MSSKTKIHLSSTEIAGLWKSYMFETMNYRILQHFLATGEDQDIVDIMKAKYQAKEARIQSIERILREEGLPIPVGFTVDDVRQHAPKLFNDILMAQYIHFMSMIAMDHYRLVMSVAPREDVRKLFHDSLNFFSDIQVRIMDMMLSKGIYIRSPFIPYPTKVEFAQSDSFMSGLWGDKRPMHVVQLMHVFLNVQRNMLGQQLLLAFAQTAEQEDVRKHIQKGHKMAEELVQDFSQLLLDEELVPPSFNGIGITASTQPAFSDKLMMNLVEMMNAYAIALYGLSISDSTRNDLFAKYTEILAATSKYAHEGAKLMIEKKYLEEPPKTVDREALVK